MRSTSFSRASTASRHRLRRLSQLLALSLLIACRPALAESPTPVTPQLAAQLEERFFEAGRVSPRKLEIVRAELLKRRNERVSIYAADYEARGKSPEKATERALKKKLVEVYDLLIGPDGHGGLLEELASESDPVQAQLLATLIAEIDYALKIEGELPKTIRIIDHLTWIFLVPWSIEGETKARRAAREATNLVNSETGLFYQTGDLAELIRRDVDISRLDPPSDSGFWQSPGPIAEVDVSQAFYGGGDPLHRGIETLFPEHSAQLTDLRTVQTKPKFDLEIQRDGGKHPYKLKLGSEMHSEPTTGALLATLGFNTDVTRYVRDFRIYVGDADVDELRNAWRVYFENHRTHLRYRFDDYLEEGEDERGRYLMAREAVLEAKPKELVRVGPWPFGSNGNEGLREARALAVFSIWIGNTDLKEAENNKLVLREFEEGDLRAFHVHHDIGHSLGRITNEQINAFPWDLARRTMTGKIKLNYHSVWHSSLRKRITYADARWTVRLIAQLARQQIEQAVAIGGWPVPVARLLTEKLIHRRNQLVETFDLLGDETPSGAIELLPVDRHLTTEDGAVVEGELVEGGFPEFTQEFDSYWRTLLAPVWERIALQGIALFQGGVGQVFEVILDPSNIGLPRGLVTEILVTMRREVSENPNPQSADEHYLVRDVVLVGLRLGGGFVVRGETTYYRKYVLVQPAGTEREARYARGTVLALLLPYHIAKGKLPETYVLLRESYMDLRARLISDDLTGGAVPLGVDATFTSARPKQSVVAVKDGKLRAFRNHSIYSEEAFGIFIKAVFLRLPILRVDASQGKLVGDLFSLDLARQQTDPAVAEAVQALVTDDDFSAIEVLDEPVHIESDFREAKTRLDFLGIARSSSGSRFDDITVTQSAGESTQSERFAQYRAGGSGFWRFFDFGERRHHLVRATTPIDEEGVLTSVPIIQANYFISDKDSHSKELSEGYLHFINALARPQRGSDQSELIAFSPELHSVNDRWGHLFVKIKMGYSRRAVERLLELDPEDYWRELARTLDVEPQAMRQYRRWMNKRGKYRRLYLGRVPLRIRRTLLRSQTALRLLQRASNPDLPKKKRVYWVVDALAKASYTNFYGYDPRILETLRRVVGGDEISVTARITQPAWLEKRLPGRVDLVGRTHEQPFEAARGDLVFRPRSSLSLYRMLDTFPY